MTSPTAQRVSSTAPTDSHEPGLSHLVPTHRLTDLPTYVFAWLDELKADARARGAKFIDLGMGNPDQPTPQPIIDTINAAYADPKNHGYPPFDGTPEFRNAVARYMQSRFGVTLDPNHEVLCLSGAKEGIAHATMAFADEHTVTLVPDIYYPVHRRATGLVGGKSYLLPLRAERGFLPDLRSIPKDVLKDARILILNYPHNPTGAIAPLELFEDAVALCKKYGILLISDLAYSELTFDGLVSPSVMQVPGAKEVALEFHSFSKTFNMAGSRLGFVVGGAKLIDALHAVRTNMGYGTPTPIQAGGAFALDHYKELEAPTVARYQRRRDGVVEAFRSLGWPAQKSHGSMFVWLPIPEGFAAQEWTKHLIDKAGVVVTPGNAFGPGGERFFRVSLVAEQPVLDEAVQRLRDAGIRFAQ